MTNENDTCGHLITINVYISSHDFDFTGNVVILLRQSTHGRPESKHDNRKMM